MRGGGGEGEESWGRGGWEGERGRNLDTEGTWLKKLVQN